jgi:hypothetical protein
MQAIAGGIGVATDKEIIRAALQPAMTGREGTTAVALPAAQKIANGSTGLTLTKLRQAKGEHGGQSGRCFPKQYHYGDPLIQLQLHLQFG